MSKNVEVFSITTTLPSKNLNPIENISYYLLKLFYCLSINFYYIFAKRNKMKKETKFTWNLIKLFCWLIFAGLSVQTGALLFNYIYSIFKPIAAENLYLGLNLSSIYNQSFYLYSCLFSLIIGISFMKAYTFYLVLSLFKILNLQKPFSIEVSNIISKISYLGFGVGLSGYIATKYTLQLSKKGYFVDEVSNFWNDSFAYLMLSAILFVISLIFKKGIELQNEIDLTV